MGKDDLLKAIESIRSTGQLATARLIADKLGKEDKSKVNALLNELVNTRTLKRGKRIGPKGGQYFYWEVGNERNR